MGLTRCLSNSEYNTGLQEPVFFLSISYIVYLGLRVCDKTEIRRSACRHKNHYVTQLLNGIALQCSLSVGKDLVGNNDHWKGSFIFDSQFSP